MDEATSNEYVLVVDDDALMREAVSEVLQEEGYACLDAARVDDGLDLIRANAELGIVLVDLAMPGKSGIDMIKLARNEFGSRRDLEFIVITGQADTRDAIEALRLGARDFILKPFEPKFLIDAVQRADQTLSLRRAGKHYQESLVAELKAKELGMHKLVRDLENAYASALECLAVAAEFRDNETGSHIRRIGEYAHLIASRLGWDRDRLRTIRLAAPLHDVGKIGIPDEILLKRGVLTDVEFSVMQNHTTIGHQILSTSSSPVMVCAANIAYSHHERWDGDGYPRRLKGADIPIEGRIIALVDVYDALRSTRPYKSAFSHERACDIVINGDGRSGSDRHFDPEVLKVFAQNTEQFAEIFARNAD